MAPTRQQSAFKKTNGVPRTSNSRATKPQKTATLEAMENQRLKEELAKCKQELAAKCEENQHLQWQINAIKRRELAANEREIEIIGMKDKEILMLISRVKQCEYMEMELRETLKERCTKHTEEIKKRDEKISELDDEARMLVMMWKRVRDEFDAYKEQESQKMEQLEKDLDMLRKTVEVAANKDDQQFKWKACEICLEQYSYEEDHVPRFLSCGHTVCHGCTKRLEVPSGVRCPFDRQETKVDYAAGEQLPKNFAVITMSD
ncbi:unnamed protein product [Caenorhabditis brenneri]